MKKLLYLLAGVIIITSCSSSKETTSPRLERKLAEKEMIKKAVESRRYIIKLDKLYTSGGGVVQLKPDSNFFIINGEIASVSLGYVGQSFASRPISGINFNAHTLKYEMTSDEGKGTYSVSVELKMYNDKFNFYLNIGSEGFCSIFLNNAHLQSVSYRGTLVPIASSEKNVDAPKDEKL